MVIHRLWNSVIERRDDVHVFETVFRRRGIFVGCQRELDFQATDAAAIPDVNLAHLTGRWRRSDRSVEAAQQANTAFPQEKPEAYPDHHPDDRRQSRHEPQAIREAGIVEAATGSLKSIHRRASAGSMRCSRISSSMARRRESSFDAVIPRRSGFAAATELQVLHARG